MWFHTWFYEDENVYESKRASEKELHDELKAGLESAWTTMDEAFEESRFDYGKFPSDDYYLNDNAEARKSVLSFFKRSDELSDVSDSASELHDVFRVRLAEESGFDVWKLAEDEFRIRSVDEFLKFESRNDVEVTFSWKDANVGSEEEIEARKSSIAVLEKFFKEHPRGFIQFG